MKYLKLIRPKQWLKNCFVIAPLIFSGNISFDLIIISIKAMIIFIIVSSCVYIFNDIRDYDFDQKHPEKKFRPIANGDITINQASIFLCLLLVITTCLLFLFNISTQGIALILLYLFLNFFYSVGLKNIPLLELAILSSGFVIRLIFGSLETSTQLSPWIIVCSGLLSLMLAVGKRRNELKYQSKLNGPSRISLKGYNVEFLDQINSMLASVTIVSYLLFCVSQYAISSLGPYILWTSPFVVFSVLRYLQLVSIQLLGEDPTALLIGDKVSVGLFVAWFLLISILIYL